MNADALANERDIAFFADALPEDGLQHVAIADDRVRRCPDRKVLAHAMPADGGPPDAVPARWSER